MIIDSEFQHERQRNQFEQVIEGIFFDVRSRVGYQYVEMRYRKLYPDRLVDIEAAAYRKGEGSIIVECWQRQGGHEDERNVIAYYRLLRDREADGVLVARPLDPEHGATEVVTAEKIGGAILNLDKAIQQSHVRQVTDQLLDHIALIDIALE